MRRSSSVSAVFFISLSHHCSATQSQKASSSPTTHLCVYVDLQYPGYYSAWKRADRKQTFCLQSKDRQWWTYLEIFKLFSVLQLIIMRNLQDHSQCFLPIFSECGDFTICIFIQTPRNNSEPCLSWRCKLMWEVLSLCGGCLFQSHSAASISEPRKTYPKLSVQKQIFKD